MKEIKLTKGFVALIDDEDFERVNQFKWLVIKGKNANYVGRWIYKTGARRFEFLHGYILDTIPSRQINIDHINHNGMDNRKANLRICTPSQNSMNRLPLRNKTCIYKGYHFDKNVNKFRVRIVYEKERITVGLFSNEIEAAKAYDKAAKKYYGEYACLNFHD